MGALQWRLNLNKVLIKGPAVSVIINISFYYINFAIQGDVNDL
jgi:hypothetical protein